MSHQHFIPQSDLDKLTWMRVFARGISANPAAYQLALTDATTIQRAVDELDEAYLHAVTTETRTAVTICDKNMARNSAEKLCRGYARRIKYNDGISDGSKTAILVRPVNPGRSPIGAPHTSPLVNII